MRPPYPVFHSRDDYASRFTDTTFWQPYVRAVCAKENLTCNDPHPGLFGTNPVYVVDGAFVVKLFTPLFGGPESGPAEAEMYRLLRAAPHIPAPRLLSIGELYPSYPQWPWPYLILSVVPGESLGEVRERVHTDDLVALARQLGPIVQRIHNLPVTGGMFIQSGERHVAFLHEQRAGCAHRQREWGHLPAHLVDEVERYLPSPALLDSLFDPTGFHIGHGDLNQDHVLGDFADGHWRLNGIIDFGNARLCDRLYDLVVIHVGLFLADKRLLRVYLDGYGADTGLRDRFTYRAMCYTLLHQYPMFNALRPLNADASSLNDLANRIWGV